MRLVYYCNNPRKPSGGVSVIYHHVIELNRLGVEACVLHSRPFYYYKWMKECPPILRDRDINNNDYFIIPEIQAAELAPKLISQSLPYAIFVQNGYYLSHCSRSLSDQDIDFTYHHAHSILSISEDTSRMIQHTYPQLSDRILRLYCSIDNTQFHCDEQKENWITYMPRKNRNHAESLVFTLKKKLPSSWQLISIDDVTHDEAAKMLRKSRIFLSFSELEGLGLPPIEAAIAGNYVIGYHGQGGLEYWQTPNFEAVTHGDICDFAEKVKARVNALNDQNISIEALKPGIIRLQNTYSLENEKKYLTHFVEKIKSTTLEKNGDPISIKLQKRKNLFQLLLK